MVQSTNVVSRYGRDRVIREDLSDVIEMVTQEDTPYTSNIGRGKCEQTFHEWNLDNLVAANEDNMAIEGDDTTTLTFTGSPPTPSSVPLPGLVLDVRPATTRVGDYTQIMRKVPGVSGTMQVVNVVGGKKQLARELMKSGREIKLDREKRLVGIKAADPGSDTLARQMAGFGAWITTNVSRTGSNPALSNTTHGYPSAAPVDGTTRPFTETLLKDVMAQCYTSGGKPTIAMMPPGLKVKASLFPGIAANRVNLSPSSSAATIIGTADVYKSDFGDISFVPNPQMRAPPATGGNTLGGNVWLIDPTMAELMTLRPVSTVELAKTGDSEKRLMIWEGTHKVNNEKAHGAIADLNNA